MKRAKLKGLSSNKGIATIAIVIIGIVILVAAGVGISILAGKNKDNKDNGTDNDIVKNYGRKVKYTGTEAINSVDWQLLYSDENYIYLIAEDYIENKYCPTKDGAKLTTFREYAAKFEKDVLDKYNGSADITDSRLKALNNNYLNENNYTSTNYNMKAVAYMLDTNIWNENFVAGDALYAIGGPTLEMLVKSYNLTHNLTGEDEYTAQVDSENGYKAIKNGKGSTLSIANQDGVDQLYAKFSRDKANGYWVASPYYALEDSVACVNFNGRVDYYSAFPLMNGLCFRPVVCLPITTNLEFKD